ncbi:unannotated protein [freshwater metagenome]|uniref:Unannotated protein n=1 Tax=freshwater metagenome TaxID=449393 RepID=A0A6J6T8N7_9ZZZZ
MHEEPLALSQASGHDEVAPHRAGHFWQRCGLNERDWRRDAHELAYRNSDSIGVAATGEERGHLIADRAGGHACTELTDGAGAFEAEDVARTWGWGIEALSLHDVGAVHGRCGDVDDDLTRAGLRVGDFVPGEHARVTGRCNDDGAHDGLSAPIDPSAPRRSG